jgi:hypothetical protein
MVRGYELSFNITLIPVLIEGINPIPDIFPVTIHSFDGRPYAL